MFDWIGDAIDWIGDGISSLWDNTVGSAVDAITDEYGILCLSGFSNSFTAQLPIFLNLSMQAQAVFSLCRGCSRS